MPMSTQPSQFLTSLVATCVDRIVTPLGLTTTRNTRLQVAVFMHFTRIDRIVAANYEQHSQASCCGQSSSSSSTSDKNQTLESGAPQQALTSGSAAIAGFPRVPRLFRSYELIGTLYIIGCLIKYAFFTQVGQLLLYLYDSSGDGKLAGMPAECMIPGRVTNHRVLRNQIGLIFSLMNLIYRAWMWYKQRAYSFCVIDAAIQDQTALANYYRLLHDQRQSSKNREREIARHPFTRFMCYQVNGMSQVAMRVSDHGHGKSVAGGSWRLRANMCPEVVQRFRLDIAFAALWIGSFLIGHLSLLVAPLMALAVLSDRGYVHNYPGCNEHLDRLVAADQLPWLSITLTPHRCVMLVFDAFENCLFAFDTAATLLMYSTLIIILNQNLLACWELLHAKVDQVLQLMRLEHYASPESSAGFQDSSDTKREMTTSESNHHHHHHHLDRRALASIPRGGPATLGQSQRVLIELQSEIRDFFKQVSDMDLLASDLLTMTLLFWLLFLLIMVHKCLAHYLTHPDFLSFAGLTFPQLLLVGLPILFIPTSLVSFTMFRLHPCCLRTYNLLGPLIAYIQLNCEKRKFADEIMEYYQHQNRPCYKILHTYPFKATTFLTLVGWTFTALGLLVNLVGFQVN